jgi:putative glutamine amidotransferase
MRELVLPRIGVTTYLEVARWNDWRVEPAALVPQTYLAGVVEAGGLPVLLPPSALASGPAAARQALAMVDGLLMIGGADIDPIRYGAPAHHETQDTRPDRDQWEVELAREALARDLPLLGICRGMQLLNVAAGGTLYQHLPEVVGNHGHRPAIGTYGVVRVQTAPGSLVAAVLGDEVKVNCQHHQALDRIGTGLVPVAWADDGAVEAVEAAGAAESVTGADRFVVAVQWHPEIGDDQRLIAALVRAAEDRLGPGPERRP